MYSAAESPKSCLVPQILMVYKMPRLLRPVDGARKVGFAGTGLSLWSLERWICDALGTERMLACIVWRIGMQGSADGRCIGSSSEAQMT